jgi:hypothetical protein
VTAFSGSNLLLNLIDSSSPKAVEEYACHEVVPPVRDVMRTRHGR